MECKRKRSFKPFIHTRPKFRITRRSQEFKNEREHKGPRFFMEMKVQGVKKPPIFID